MSMAAWPKSEAAKRSFTVSERLNDAQKGSLKGISIAFEAKRPGTQMRTVTVQANFSYQANFESNGPVAYETLLLDSMRGDATLFTRRDEVEAEWRIITPIEKAWAHLPAPDFPNYAAGSEGPHSWHELLKIRGNTAHQAIGHGE
jgi:glucose-6-phosphate 1-dehydrogenase